MVWVEGGPATRTKGCNFPGPGELPRQSLALGLVQGQGGASQAITSDRGLICRRMEIKESG